MEQFMTPEEVAAAMRVSLRFVYKLLAEGQLRGLRAGRRWLITEQNISDFLAAGQHQSAQGGPDGVVAGAAGPARSGSPAPGQAGSVSPGPTLAPGSPGSGPGGSPLANRKNKRHR